METDDLDRKISLIHADGDFLAFIDQQDAQRNELADEPEDEPALTAEELDAAINEELNHPEAA